MKILVIHGPNLNMLGKRDPTQYGSLTMKEINMKLLEMAKNEGAELEFFQSNHEGAIIDYLQKDSSQSSQGILINPGALTHYGYSLRDALADTMLPVVEVHLSDVDNREEFRKIDVLEGIVLKKISGLKEKSYTTGLDVLLTHLKHEHTN